MNPSTSLSSLLTRLSLGIVLLAHGALKLFVFTVPGTVGYFESLGLPAMAAYLTIFGEIAGGIALILGVYPRLVALLSLPILLGATWTHFGNGWLFSNAGGGWEFPALLVIMATVVAIQDAGEYAVKRLPFVDSLVPRALKS